MEITIETTIDATIAEVWTAWITPDAITQWNFAADSWSCPEAQVDLKVGGKFKSRMEAKDGSMGFDFEGTYTAVEEMELIEYVMDDGRKVRVTFEETDNGVRVTEIFEPEDQHPPDYQKQGWQAILDNFKRHVEAVSPS